MKTCLIILPILFASRTGFADMTVTPKQSECLRGMDDGVEEVMVEAVGCGIRIAHLNVATNCCLEYSAKVSVDGSTVDVKEIDDGPPCDCFCPFNLEIVIDGLDPGTYTVVFRSLSSGDGSNYSVEIPPCAGYWILAPEVWSPMGVRGVEVPVLITNERPLGGFSFGTTYPLAHASMAAVRFDGTVTERLKPEVLLIDIHNEINEAEDFPLGWATCMMIAEVEPPYDDRMIPAGTDQLAARLIYDILPPGESVPRSMSVPFVDGLGKVPLAFSVQGIGAVVPQVQNGIIQLTAPPKFLRGDANDDGKVDISDPIYLLGYLFQGGAEPPCDDAADANDDGGRDISDAVSVLNHLFLGGTIPPPLPGGPSGFDPTLDDLGCERGG